MNSTHPSSFGGSARCVGLALTCTAVVAMWSLASGAEEPLVLGSEHIGMTAESMTDASVPDAAQAASADEIPSEWNSAVTGTDPWEPVDHLGAAGPVAGSYEECIEIAVRKGNGFSAASSVCEAIFPEPSVAVEETASQPAPPEAAVGATGAPLASDSEEPLVLRLHGTPPSDAADADAAPIEAAAGAGGDGQADTAPSGEGVEAPDEALSEAEPDAPGSAPGDAKVDAAPADG